MISLRDAVTVTGGFPTLSGVDLDVSAGEICLLEGENGAGKTSLLRLCAGLALLRSGAGTVGGLDLGRDRPSIRRLVGLLGHGTGLYEDLSVIENLRFFGRAARVPTETIPAALDRLELPARVRTLPMSMLSAGQRRRAALAALVIRRPSLWLLDEPHTGIDRTGRDVVDALITDAAAAGATVLFASHESDRASGIATRSIRLAGGTVVGDGLPGAGR